MPSANLSTRDAKRQRPSNRIMSIQEWCDRNGFSLATGWRIRKSGDGPKVTQVSARRIGIREDHHSEWFNEWLKRRPFLKTPTKRPYAALAANKEFTTRT